MSGSDLHICLAPLESRLQTHLVLKADLNAASQQSIHMSYIKMQCEDATPKLLQKTLLRDLIESSLQTSLTQIPLNEFLQHPHVRSVLRHECPHAVSHLTANILSRDTQRLAQTNASPDQLIHPFLQVIPLLATSQGQTGKLQWLPTHVCLQEILQQLLGGDVQGTQLSSLGLLCLLIQNNLKELLGKFVQSCVAGIVFGEDGLQE